MVLTECDVVLCSFEDDSKHFGAICCLQLQGRTVKMNLAVTNSGGTPINPLFYDLCILSYT